MFQWLLATACLNLIIGVLIGGVMTAKKGAKRRSKYPLDVLIAMFRKAAEFRNEMRAAGFTDNGGAIHSSERILNLLGLRLNYPELGHQNNLRKSAKAEFSIAALKAHKRGNPVKIEHLSPIRDFTCRAIENIKHGASDAQLRRFVRRHFKLVLLTPEEALRLNKQNRSKMTRNPCDRLRDAGIRYLVRQSC